MTATIKPRRRPSYSTVITETVDVDINLSAEDMAEDGWHHETECAGPQGVGATESDALAALDQLRDWHDQAHGLVLWISCKQSPCSVIPVGVR